MRTGIGCVLLFWLYAAAAPAQPNGALGEILEIRPVSFERPLSLFRARPGGRGEATPDTVSDAWLIRVRVARPERFLPRADADPVFVLGTRPARTLVSPLRDGVAVLLAPAPGPGEAPPEVLWLTPPGAEPGALSGRRLEALARAARDGRSPGRSLRLAATALSSARQAPAAGGAAAGGGLRVRDLAELRRRLAGGL